MTENLREIILRNLRYESKIRSVEDLIADQEKIDYAPPYQRNYVWNVEKASYFIESLLLNREIPPLILFRRNEEVEIVDGRQRYETILRFKDGRFKLSGKGLSILKSLAGKHYYDLSKDESDVFKNIHLRTYVYELHQNINYNDSIEEEVKREIFSRYNSGITPLTQIDVIKAQYIDNELNIHFRQLLDRNAHLLDTIRMLFAIRYSDIQLILRKIRQLLVMHQMPIHSYVHNKQKINVLYDHYSKLIENEGNWEAVFKTFIRKINFLLEIQASLNISGGQVFECLFWALSICKDEKVGFENIDSSRFKKKLIRFITKHLDKLKKPQHYRITWVHNSFHTIASFFESETRIDFDSYLKSSNQSRSFYKNKILAATKTQEISITENISQLKKDATSSSIGSILNKISEGNYLVRPYYQRGKVISTTKSSAVIESILLGFQIPPIFVYKRKSGKVEVIDGQQRLLTFISFTGNLYLDENNRFVNSENNNFSLNLKNNVLRELHGKKFRSLTVEMQKKIMSYNINVVEINEDTNPAFDPIDQFIRFNLKPYPIGPNTFESWNALVNKRFVDKVKAIYKTHASWFYILRKNERMYNEEQITKLIYLCYILNGRHRTFKQLKKIIAMSIIQNRLHLRFSIKNEITQTLLNKDLLIELLDAADQFEEDFLYKIQTLLTATANNSISDAFEELLYSNTERKSRTTHRFYLLTIILINIPMQHVENSPEAIRKSIVEVSDRITKVRHVDQFEELIKNIWHKHGALKHAFQDI